MARIDQLIEEIKGLKKESTRRTALQIYNILENNKPLFLSKIEQENFNPVLQNFENLSNTSAAEYNSPGFKRDYERAYELLSFHINRI